MDISSIVLDAIAAKYENIKKEVDVIMGGEVLDYPAKRILNQGRKEGLELGRSEGIQLGRSEGIQLGRSEGIQLGRSEGRQLGHSEGVEEGIKAFILDNIEDNIPKERIIEKLQRRFDLTEEQALEKYEKYGG